MAPKNVVAINNLATLLSEQPGKAKESLQYIEQAIELAGQQPGLLDTKAMILVFEGKAAEAVPLLETAASIPDADPRYHFHLAVAYDLLGQADKARQALKAADDGVLTRQVLTAADQKMLADLRRKLQ